VSCSVVLGLFAYNLGAAILFAWMAVAATLRGFMLLPADGLQKASIITSTLFEVFFTFARTGGGISGPNVPPFKFTCPAVEPQIPRLGVTLVFSLHCSSFKPQCWRPVHTYPPGGIRRFMN
jgi:hypothetical protein